jgi:cyclase
MWKTTFFVVPLLSGLIPNLLAQQDFDKVHVQIAKVAGNVYLLTGDGGNIAADIGDEGIVLVDDQYAPFAEKIQAA